MVLDVLGLQVNKHVLMFHTRNSIKTHVLLYFACYPHYIIMDISLLLMFHVRNTCSLVFWVLPPHYIIMDISLLLMFHVRNSIKTRVLLYFACYPHYIIMDISLLLMFHGEKQH